MNQGIKNIANGSDFVVNSNNQQQNCLYHYQQQNSRFQSQNNYNPPQNSHYQQQQQQQFNLQEEQAIILNSVYEDFQNFLNLLYSYQAVKEHFKNDPQNILVSINYNRLLTQMNLSNSIHYDLFINQKNPDLKSFLTKTKFDLKKQIRRACPPEFQQEIQFYEQYCLNEVVIRKQNELKVNYKIPTIESMQYKAQQCKQETLVKLKNQSSQNLKI